MEHKWKHMYRSALRNSRTRFKRKICTDNEEHPSQNYSGGILRPKNLHSSQSAVLMTRQWKTWLPNNTKMVARLAEHVTKTIPFPISKRDIFQIRNLRFMETEKTKS